ncbi:MAG: hypothetical protein IJO10_10190 [Clostridia bacterium]|nr:hypothetical protein [Clostridia bacterium]
MKKTSQHKYTAALLLPLFLFLSGCSRIGEKASSIGIVYAIMAVCSFLLLLGYCFLVHKKDAWFLLLFASVLVVNIGYYCLSISKTLEEALLANRIAYLGSVVLPLSMLMIILGVVGMRCKKWMQGALILLSLLVFLVAASPGYLDIYYKEVSLEFVNGVTMLKKVYGPWHALNLVYLLFHFTTMIIVIAYAALKKRTRSFFHVLILAAAVLVNIGIWLLEQYVKLDFEFLSVSYIISELFLLGLSLLMQEEKQYEQTAELQEAAEALTVQMSAAESSVQEVLPAEEPLVQREEILPEAAEAELKRRLSRFSSSIATLTQTERTIYELYLAGKGTKDILAELNIKENTLKYHNKNIYSKLEVSSRKQMMELARELNAPK